MVPLVLEGSYCHGCDHAQPDACVRDSSQVLVLCRLQEFDEKAHGERQAQEQQMQEDGNSGLFRKIILERQDEEYQQRQ